MIRPIVHDEALLSRPSLPAGADDLAAAQDLLDTLRAHERECVGMAANMIGVSRRVIVFNDEGQLRAMLNPEIIRRSRPYETEEGCLSLTGVRPATRYLSIRVRFQDTALAEHTETFTGMTAQIIQHECDHLEGILI